MDLWSFTYAYGWPGKLLLAFFFFFLLLSSVSILGSPIDSNYKAKIIALQKQYRDILLF